MPSCSCCHYAEALPGKSTCADCEPYNEPVVISDELRRIIDENRAARAEDADTESFDRYEE